MNITNDEVTRFINGFYRAENAHLLALRKSCEEERIPIILKETESMLGFIIRAARPARLLEIGTAAGYSAAFFASLGVQVTTIEKSPQKAQAAQENIEALGLSARVRILTGDGEEAIKNGLAAGEKFEMLFIDAAKSHYQRFLSAALSHLEPQALIAADNVLLKGTIADATLDPGGRFKTNIKKMRQYLSFVSDDPRFDTVIVSCGDGLALSRYIDGQG